MGLITSVSIYKALGNKYFDVNSYWNNVFMWQKVKEGRKYVLARVMFVGSHSRAERTGYLLQVRYRIKQINNSILVYSWLIILVQIYNNEFKSLIISYRYNNDKIMTEIWTAFEIWLNFERLIEVEELIRSSNWTKVMMANDTLLLLAITNKNLVIFIQEYLYLFIYDLK